jgi:hypothetical protein
VASVRLSAWAQPATDLAATTVKGAALATVRLFVVDSASHCGGEHVRLGRFSGLCSLGRRRISKPLCWRVRQVRSLFRPLFTQSSWSHRTTIEADTTGDVAALASVLSVGVGTTSHSGSGHDV